MLDKINALIDEVTSFDTKSKDELEAFRIKFLSKKGKTVLPLTPHVLPFVHFVPSGQTEALS